MEYAAAAAAKMLNKTNLHCCCCYCRRCYIIASMFKILKLRGSSAVLLNKSYPFATRSLASSEVNLDLN